MDAVMLKTLCILIAVVAVVESASPVGCYIEDRRARKLNINPGDYDPLGIRPADCASKCGSMNFLYAGVTYGKYCFCGNQLPPTSDPAGCTTTCSGSPMEPCGSDKHISVYDAVKPPTGLALASDVPHNSVVETQTPVVFSASMDAGMNVFLAMDYGEGAAYTPKNGSGIFNHTFISPGEYRVSLQATDLNETFTPQVALLSVMVDQAVDNATIECQPAFATFEEGYCYVQVWRGTAMKLQDTVNGATPSTIYLADPGEYRVGPAIPTKGPVSSLTTPALGVWKLQSAEFQHEGVVVAWEYYAQTAGSIKFLVMKPSSASYCFNTNSATACTSTHPGLYHACTGDTFCAASKRCSGACTPASRYPATHAFIARQEVTVTLETGYNVLFASEFIRVYPGDVLGVEYTGAGMLNVISSTAAMGDVDPTPTSTSTRLLLRAVMTTGVRATLTYTFQTPGTYNVAVNVSNLRLPRFATNNTDVLVLEGVNATEIEAPICAARNEPVRFTILPHTGTNVTHNWDFGGVQVNESEPMFYDHTFTTLGEFNVSVTSYNMLSQKSNTTLILIQDRVTGLTVTSAPQQTNQAVDFTLTLVGGSDYTCEWTFGDGTTSNSTSVTVPSGSTLSHTYSTPAIYSVTVNCSNCFSSDLATISQVIQDPITGLTLERNGARKLEPFVIRFCITKGTDPQFYLTFEGTNLTFSPSGANCWATQTIPGKAVGDYPLELMGWNLVSNETLNINFTVEVGIKDFVATVSALQVPTQHDVTFTADMTEGSNVYCLFDFGDGNNDTFFIGRGNDWAGHGPEVRVHQYQLGSTFNTEVRCWNSENSTSYRFTVVAIQSVETLEMTCDTYALFAPPTTATINFTTTGGIPNEAAIFFEYGDDRNSSETFDITRTYTHEYRDIKKFALSANISNPVSQTRRECTINVIEKLEGLRVETTPQHPVKDEPYQVCVVLFRGPSDVDCNITIDYGDGSPAISFMRVGHGENGRDCVNYTYTTLSQRTITVNVQTPLQSDSTSYSLEVEEKVLRQVVLTSTAPVKFGPAPDDKVCFDLTYNGSPLPTNAFIQWDFGDGSTQTPESFTSHITATGGTKQFCNTYSQPGDYKATVTIYNPASSETFEVFAGIYKEITAVTVTPCYKPHTPLNAPCQQGIDGDPTRFPRDVPVQLNVSTDGTTTYFEVLATDMASNIAFACNKTSSPLELNFDQPGTYTVTVNASNPLSSVVETFTITLLDSVLNVTLDDRRPLTAADEVKEVHLDLKMKGTNSCCVVDFGDGTKETFADDVAACAVHATAFPGAVYKGILSTPQTLNHIYTSDGSYTMRAVCANAFSRSEGDLQFAVSGVDCSKPSVQIKHRRPYFDHPEPYHRSQKIVIYGRSNISCATTFNNRKKWTVTEVDRYNGSAIRQVDVSMLGTFTLAALIMPERFLELGVYRACYFMTMETTVAVEASTCTYLEITPTPLVGTCAHGGLSKLSVGTGKPVTFNPSNFSKDPDVDPNGPQGFDSFSWECVMEEGASSGCSGINATTSASLNFDPTAMGFSVGDLVKLTAHLHKDTRQTSCELEVEVVSGVPPKIAIECTAGSLCLQQPDGLLIPPSARLGLSAECLDCGPNDPLSYQWICSEYIYQWPWKPLLMDECAPFITGLQGLNSKEIAIKKDLFAMKFEENIDRFRFGVTVTRGGTSATVYTNFRINRPPSGGNCSLTPGSGVVSWDKAWTISCWNWDDSDGIVEYSFYAKMKNYDLIYQITSVDDISQGVHVDLPQGAAYDDYYETVYARIKDKHGAATTVEVARVRVAPLSSEAMKQKAAELSSNWNTNLMKIKEEGSTEVVTEAMSTTASVLNQACKISREAYSKVHTAANWINTAYDVGAENRTNAYPNADADLQNEELDTYNRERDDRANLRESMAEACGSVPFGTATATKQVSGCLAEIVKQPEELTHKAIASITATSRAMAEALANGTVKMDPEEFTVAVQNILAAVGGVSEGMGFAGKDGTLSELDRASKTELYKEYDTDLESTDEKIEADSLEDAQSQHRGNTYEKMSGQEASTVGPLMDQTMELVGRGFQLNSVPGERLSFTAPRIRVAMENTDGKDLAGKEIALDGSDAKFKLPDDLASIFGGENANKSFLVQTALTPNTPYRYSKNSDAISNTSHILTLNIKASSGDNFPVRNTPSPIEFYIPRDPNMPPLNFSKQDPYVSEKDFAYPHKVEVVKDGSSLHVNIQREKNVQYAVMISYGMRPSLNECDYVALLPPDMNDTSDPHRETIFLDNVQVNNFKGWVYIKVRELLPSEWNMNVTSCADLPRWKNGTNPFTGAYSFRAFSSGCYYYNTTIADWDWRGMRVGPNTDDRRTHCYADHLTTFAGGWVVVPNTIDWNFVFSNAKFEKNVTIYVTEIVIAIVYILAAIWARREDRKDLEKLGLTPLPDNDPRDKYYYEIMTVTGMRKSAGCDSKVCCILSGEYDETDVRMLDDSKRKLFRRGATDCFLMSVPRPLGALNYVRIWHDNSGKGKFASWYLKYLIVRDVQTNEKFIFIANKWFAVEEGDGQVDRVIPVAGREQMTEFGHLFAQKTQKNLVDGHLWFSVVARPPQSRFTRLQRVSCCLCLLFVTMLANAMFYEKGDGPKAVTFGPFALSVEQISIGIMSTLIVFPVSLVIITLFRKAKARKKRPSRVAEALRRAPQKSAASVADVQPEVGSIFTMSRTPTMFSDPKRPETSASRPDTSMSMYEGDTVRLHAEDKKEGKGKPKKKKFELPWWCTIVAWVLLWATTLTSAAFVTFYAIMFQDEKAKKWITSMLISFFTSVFVTQPVKVFLMAIVLSLLVKTPTDDDDDEVEDEEEHTLKPDEELLHDVGSYGAARPRKIGYKPPDPAALEKARQNRLKEIKMWEIVREIIIYAFFLWILMVISYRNRSISSYNFKASMERVFINHNTTDQWFPRITNKDKFWTWAKSGFISGIRADNYYNQAPPLLLRGFINDKVSRIMGFATMRQLRVRPSQCQPFGIFKRIIHECNVGYGFDSEDQRDFGPGWTPLGVNETATRNEYRYSTASELDGYPYWGELNMYGGGGYVVEIRGSKQKLLDKMIQLEEESWIDRYTRAIFVEFTVYNPQVNLFVVSTLLVEFQPTGGSVANYRFEPASLLPYMDNVMLFTIICEVVYLLFTVYFLVKMIRDIWQQRGSYFTQFWNLVEVGILAMSLSSVVIYFYRLIITNSLTAVFARSHGNEYQKFQYVGYWNELFSYMIGWLVFFGTLKFLKLLRFNKRMSLLASTLKNSSNSLIHFSIIFWIIFLAFIQIFYLIYMNISSAFKTFITSWESGVLMMMGKFDIYAMLMQEPILTQVLVFLFVLSVTFVIVNMFISILNETFASVRDDISKQNNDYEIVSFMVDRFKKWTGLGSVEEAAPNAGPDGAQNPYVASPTSVEDFPDRIDRLLNSISNVYMEDNLRYNPLLTPQDSSSKQLMKNLMQPSSSGLKMGVQDNSMTKVHTN